MKIMFLLKMIHCLRYDVYNIKTDMESLNKVNVISNKGNLY